jgi:magnesium transporter
MPRLATRRSKKAGLPPGTLVYLGNKPNEKSSICSIRFNQSEFEEKLSVPVDKLKETIVDGSITWINCAGVANTETVAAIGKQFNLHPLLLEDVVSSIQRPKMEDYGDVKYIVINHLKATAEPFEYVTEQISVVLGKNYVLSFEEGDADFLAFIRTRLKDPARFRSFGADYLLYIMLDSVVDNFFVVLEKVGEDIEKLEEELVKDPSAETLPAIYRAKRSLLLLRRSVWPLREVLSALQRDPAAVSEGTRFYLRDVYDHIVEIIDLIENFRDMSSGMLDVYLSSVSNKMNSIMKILTLITTIFMPLTFIVGLYGMNFHYMPELSWHYGYPLVWISMLTVALLMVGWFRRKGWFD